MNPASDKAAEELVRRVCRWIAVHPATFDGLMGLCASLTRHGLLVTRGAVFTLALERGMQVSDAREYRRDHNLWSVLARYMVMIDPSLLAGIRFRSSPVDGVDLPAMWAEEVGAERFRARSLREARELWKGAVA